MKKVVLLLALCACTPQAPAPFGNTPAAVVPASTGKLLVAKPAQVSFALGGLIAPPQVVRLKSSAPLTRTLSAWVADPTQVGVSVRRSTRLHDAKAVFYPISMGMHGGQTTVTITDISQPSITVKVPVSQQGCGRPDNLAHADHYGKLSGEVASHRPKDANARRVITGAGGAPAGRRYSDTAAGTIGDYVHAGLRFKTAARQNDLDASLRRQLSAAGLGRSVQNETLTAF